MVSFFVKYLPMTTITTTHKTNVRHFSYMALDGSQTFFTHFSQFLCCNLRILSNLIFYPFIKIVFLSAILSYALCWSHECHHNKSAIDSPCRRGNAPLLASLHDASHTRPPVLNIGCTIQHISYKRIVWIRDMRLENILWCNLRRQNARILNLNGECKVNGIKLLLLQPDTVYFTLSS